MTAAAAVSADGIAFVAVSLAAIAVLVGLQLRSAATLAVLLTVSAIVLSDPSPVFAALSGLSAAAYLVLRHAVGAPTGVVTATAPTMIAAVALTLVGVVSTALPLQLPWLPLLAPLAVFAMYALAVRPFVGNRK